MYKYPVITDEEHIKNKQIDYRYYLVFLRSTYAEESSANYRLLNVSVFFDEEEVLESIKKINIKKETYDKGIKKFLKTDLIDMKNNEVLVKVKDDDNSFYQLLTMAEIDKLLYLSSNEIKIYLLIKCLTQYSKNEYKEIKLKLIAEKMGMSLENSKTIAKSIKKLEKYGLINYYINKSKRLIDNKLIKIDKYFIKIKRN